VAVSLLLKIEYGNPVCLKIVPESVQPFTSVFGPRARQMTDGVTPDVVHDERLPDIVVSIAIVELPDIERIERRDNIHVAVGVHAEGGESELFEISSRA
jgi:hypothetical protein